MAKDTAPAAGEERCASEDDERPPEENYSTLPENLSLYYPAATDVVVFCGIKLLFPSLMLLATTVTRYSCVIAEGAFEQ